MQIEHVSIWTDQLEVLKQFYVTYFEAVSGEKYSNPRTGFESYFLSFDQGARLELMQMPGILALQKDGVNQFTGYAHLAFTLGSEEAVLNLTERLRQAGCRVVGEPRRTGDGYFESCVLDPDFNRVEICA